jgi:hypothetical protein
MSETKIASPWMKLRTEGAAYAKRSGRFLSGEVKAGRLRAARIGGRGEYLTRAEWLDQWIEDQARPVLVSVRRWSR